MDILKLRVASVDTKGLCRLILQNRMLCGSIEELVRAHRGGGLIDIVAEGVLCIEPKQQMLFIAASNSQSLARASIS